MGIMALPPVGTIYTDTQAVIYTVQQHPVYAPVCQPLWQAARTRAAFGHQQRFDAHGNAGNAFSQQ